MAHGFLLIPGQPAIAFDAPGAASYGTMPVSVNTRGDVLGYYSDSNLSFHGFLRRHDGPLIPFDAPGATTSAFTGTIPAVINDSGLIIGYYQDDNFAFRGFGRQNRRRDAVRDRGVHLR